MNKKIFSLVLLFCFLFYSSKVQAEVATNKDGQIIFKTTDTAASEGAQIKWQTVGFNICKEATRGDPTKQKHGRIMLDPKWRKTLAGENGVYHITFTIPEKIIIDAMNKAGIPIEDNEKIYINGIHQVSVNGVMKGGPFHTKTGIEQAENWSNKDDWKIGERFDVGVYWQASLAPVSIEYQALMGEEIIVLGENKFQDQAANALFEINSEIAPNIIEGLNLFSIYYVSLDDVETKLDWRTCGINPADFYGDYLEDLSYIRDREIRIASGGIKIIARYKEFSNKLEWSKEEESKREFSVPKTQAIIAADRKGSESFHVGQGIPVSESLYTNVLSNKYLMGYRLLKKYGNKVYPIQVKQNITLKYMEEDPISKELIEKQENRVVARSYQVERPYSFWKIDYFGIYKVDRADISNQAFPFKATMVNEANNDDNIVCETNKTNGYLVEPDVKTIYLDSKVYWQKDFPDLDFEEEADQAIGEIYCRNDKLIIHGQEIMTDEFMKNKTQDPLDNINLEGLIHKNVLYKPGLQIPNHKKNGEYESRGRIYYEALLEINMKNRQPPLSYKLNPNSVLVHTPVVGHGKVEDLYRKNQMLFPSKKHASLILDLPFHIGSISLGDHRGILGYGYKDYEKHIRDRQIKFPFDVCGGNSSKGDFFGKGTWISLENYKQFYLPTWVKEGHYQVKFRNIALNALEDSQLLKEEQGANLNLDNYVAVDYLDVEVSGRVFDFHLYDISDYPLWEKVFRKKVGSIRRTDFVYPVGIRNKNKIFTGQDRRFTLPIINGSHPEYKNIGAIKTGYKTRFSLTTIGSMDGKDDYIKIIPKFYYINPKGKNRQEVDIYYEQRLEGEKNNLIKMGSEIDLRNPKTIKTGSGFMGIKAWEIYQTAFLQNMTPDEFKNQNRKVYTYKNIMIPGSLRTFIGYSNKTPPGVERNKIARSVQKWYGEYYLPSDIKVVEKDFNLLKYSYENGPLSMEEDFWLKDGYVIVNFDIETIKDKNNHLSYINKENAQEGYCNMWKDEGFLYRQKDYRGEEFNFIDGDYVLYYTDKSAGKDWISSGTH